jgi:diguanylate cyclase (GGDEF)-like protein
MRNASAIRSFGAIRSEVTHLAITLLLAALCAAVLFFYNAEHNRFSSEVRDIDAARARALSLKDFMSTLQDAETGQRGFVITGDDAFLAPYDSAVRKLDASRRKLAQAFAGEPGAEARIGAIDFLSAARVRRLGAAIAARRAEGFESAQALIVSGEGKHLMDAVRREIGALIEAQEAEIDRMVAAAEAESGSTIAKLSLGSALVLLAIMILLGRSIAEMRESRRLNAVLAHASSHDELTGLSNRKAFMAALEECVRKAERGGAAPAVLFVDLDGFKAVNDISGHVEGDRLLKAAARKIEGVVRASDLVARLGGDEFAVLLPHTPCCDELDEMQIRLKAAIRTLTHENASGAVVGASVGSASYPSNGRTGAQLLSHADKAMYGDKARSPTRRATAGVRAASKAAAA